MFADPSAAVEGIGGLVVQTVDSTALLFNNRGLQFRKFHHLEAGDAVRLQMFFSVDNPDNLGPLTITAYHEHEGAEPDHTWVWTVNDLKGGTNALDLYFRDAVGPTDHALIIERVRIEASNRAADVVCSLDRLRLFIENGTMLARAELNPAQNKSSGTRVITWIIDPFGV